MPNTDSPPLPRYLRAMNVAALLLFAAGAGFHLRSWLGMRELRDSPPASDAELFTGLREFDRYWELAQIGNWLVGAAAALALVAAVAAVIVRRRAAPRG